MKAKEYEQMISSISEKLTNDTKLRNLGSKKFGEDNLWEGASGFFHQIDASIEIETDVLLIECKCWESNVRAIEFLTFFGRLIDIKGNEKHSNLNIRGAIATTKGWQSGAKKLVKYYRELCSIFLVTENQDITDLIHTHFIKPSSIQSGEAFGIPSIKHT